MRKFSAKKILLTIFGILMIIVFFQFFSLLSFPDSNIALEKGDPGIKLNAKESIAQKFTATRDSLTKVEFLLHTPGINFANKAQVKMQLADASCQKPLRDGQLQASFLSSNNLYEFSFAKVADSQGKIFCVIANFQPGQSKAKSLQLFTTTIQQIQFLPENPATQETYAAPLSIRPVYTNSNILQSLNELNQRISQYKPWFLKQFYLATILILFVILSVVSVIILITL